MQRGMGVDLISLADAVLTQRQERMNDNGPPLRGVGSARFQMNGNVLVVGMAQSRPGKATELVNRITRFAHDRWLAVSWTYTAERDDPAIVDALRANGYQARESLRLMGCVGPLIETGPPPTDVSVGPIISVEEMQDYERISSWGFNYDAAPSREHILIRGRERWDEQQANWYQYYLGRLNSKPVGGAYVSLWERVPTIYGVVTTPPARNRGVARQVMLRLSRDVLSRGFGWTCLYVAVGNPAQRLYESLGYTQLLEQTTYQWGEPRW